MAIALEALVRRRRRAWSGTRRPTSPGSTWSCSPAASATATTCAAARWRRIRRSWRAVRDHAARGGYVLGVCNGFQILTEAGLLPGALLRNAGCASCRWTAICGSSAPTPRSPAHYQRGQVFRAPMAHGDGNYFADDATLDRLEGEGLVAFRYATPAGEVTPRGQPQRQRPQHRRHLQPQSARARPDAAPRGPGRSADGRHRRQAAVRRARRGACRMRRDVNQALAPRVRAHRRGIRPRPGDHGPHAEPDRARHVQRDVVGALLATNPPASG